MKRSDFRHVVALPVRWGDMDALGHVNNVQYIRYAESGRVAYFDDVFGAVWQGTQGPILAAISCDFRAQVKYPADLEIATRMVRVGGKSFALESGVFVVGEDQPAAELKATGVWFDYAAQQPAPVPDDIRAQVRDFELITPEGV